MTARTMHFAAIAVFATLAASAAASPFYYPPEVYAPAWETSFPYQRNIDYTFDNPLNIFQADYEGYLDPQLKYSDTVDYTGNLWYLRWGPGLTHGAIGAYMDGDPNDKNLDLRFGFDNVKVANPVKHVWLEIVYKVVGNPQGTLDLLTPNTSQITGRQDWDLKPDFLPDGWRLHKAWFEVRPNPEHETIDLNLTLANPGDAVWIDRLHVATECVPEPTTMGALVVAIGLCGLAARRRRR